MRPQEASDEGLIALADAQHRRVCADEHDLLLSFAEIDRRELWSTDADATCMAHWVRLRYGISAWKAERWVGASHELGSLPLVAEAFTRRELGIDRVVELTRLCTASAESEASLLAWACPRPAGAIRERADREIRWSREQVEGLVGERCLRWEFLEDGRAFELWTRMPAAEGAVVLKALRRQAQALPIPAAEAGPFPAAARMADALVAMASARIGADPDPDRGHHRAARAGRGARLG